MRQNHNQIKQGHVLIREYIISYDRGHAAVQVFVTGYAYCQIFIANRVPNHALKHREKSLAGRGQVTQASVKVACGLLRLESFHEEYLFVMRIYRGPNFSGLCRYVIVNSSQISAGPPQHKVRLRIACNGFLSRLWLRCRLRRNFRQLRPDDHSYIFIRRDFPHDAADNLCQGLFRNKLAFGILKNYHPSLY